MKKHCEHIIELDKPPYTKACINKPARRVQIGVFIQTRKHDMMTLCRKHAKLEEGIW